MSIKLKKRKLLWVISGAIDLVGVTDISHGKRVAYIASIILSKLEGFPWSLDDVITSSLLHDCGVSSTDVHEKLVHEMEWSLANVHCKRGEQLLLLQPEFNYLAAAIGRHHTRWIDLPKDKNSSLANLIFLADRLDVLIATAEGPILKNKEQIIDKIKNYSGSLFSPDLVESFLQVSNNDNFWINWSKFSDCEYLKEWMDEIDKETISYSSLKDLFAFFGACVDGKSHFTYSHSVGVASLSRKIAELNGISGEMLDELELAGLIHDMGKLKVPDEILDKPEKLLSDERYIIQFHSQDTYNILSQVKELEHIAKWASQHHEKLNGSGYPNSEKGKNLPVEARIIAIADIFQALAQNRPYRKGLPIRNIMDILEDMTLYDELDRDLVELVEHNQAVCLKAAFTESSYKLSS
ncbi:MAG: HD domain-containing protein [Spirochaetaceae bacterium]